MGTVPIDYSAEERAAIADLTKDSGSTVKSAPVTLTTEDLKRLASSIPTTRDELYAAMVDWEALDSSDLIGLRGGAFLDTCATHSDSFWKCQCVGHFLSYPIYIPQHMETCFPTTPYTATNIDLHNSPLYPNID